MLAACFAGQGHVCINIHSSDCRILSVRSTPHYLCLCPCVHSVRSRCRVVLLPSFYGNGNSGQALSISSSSSHLFLPRVSFFILICTALSLPLLMKTRRASTVLLLCLWLPISQVYDGCAASAKHTSQPQPFHNHHHHHHHRHPTRTLLCLLGRSTLHTGRIHLHTISIAMERSHRA